MHFLSHSDIWKTELLLVENSILHFGCLNTPRAVVPHCSLILTHCILTLPSTSKYAISARFPATSTIRRDVSHGNCPSRSTVSKHVSTAQRVPLGQCPKSSCCGPHPRLESKGDCCSYLWPKSEDSQGTRQSRDEMGCFCDQGNWRPLWRTGSCHHICHILPLAAIWAI